MTPKNLITNPFDVGLDDLHLPAYMSPGLFAVSSTPASEEKVLITCIALDEKGYPHDSFLISPQKHML